MWGEHRRKNCTCEEWYIIDPFIPIICSAHLVGSKPTIPFSVEWFWGQLIYFKGIGFWLTVDLRLVLRDFVGSWKRLWQRWNWLYVLFKQKCNIFSEIMAMRVYKVKKSQVDICCHSMCCFSNLDASLVVAGWDVECAGSSGVEWLVSIFGDFLHWSSPVHYKYLVQFVSLTSRWLLWCEFFLQTAVSWRLLSPFPLWHSVITTCLMGVSWLKWKSRTIFGTQRRIKLFGQSGFLLTEALSRQYHWVDFTCFRWVYTLF